MLGLSVRPPRDPSGKLGPDKTYVGPAALDWAGERSSLHRPQPWLSSAQRTAGGGGCPYTFSWRQVRLRHAHTRELEQTPKSIRGQESPGARRYECPLARLKEVGDYSRYEEKQKGQNE
jgi:hypothetical protein